MVEWEALANLEVFTGHKGGIHRPNHEKDVDWVWPTARYRRRRALRLSGEQSNWLEEEICNTTPWRFPLGYFRRGTLRHRGHFPLPSGGLHRSEKYPH